MTFHSETIGKSQQTRYAASITISPAQCSCSTFFTHSSLLSHGDRDSFLDWIQRLQRCLSLRCFSLLVLWTMEMLELPAWRCRPPSDPGCLPVVLECSGCLQMVYGVSQLSGQTWSSRCTGRCAGLCPCQFWETTLPLWNLAVPTRCL